MPLHCLFMRFDVHRPASVRRLRLPRWIGAGLVFGMLAPEAFPAERLVLQVLPEAGARRAERRQLTAVSLEISRELSSLEVKALPSEKETAPRCGAEVECFRKRAREVEGEHLLVVAVAPQGPEVLDLELVWVDSQRQSVVRRAPRGVARASLPEVLRDELAALVPPFARKGWGGLVVDPEVVRVRVDGRALPAATPVVPLVAGSHEVDLLLPSGASVLTREEVPEGARLKLRPLVPAAGSRELESGYPSLRPAAFATFGAGALAVAGSLVAAGLSRRTVNAVDGCRGPTDVACASFAQAEEAHASAQGLARVANVLLYTGLGLSLAGAGLFTLDRSPPSWLRD